MQLFLVFIVLVCVPLCGSAVEFQRFSYVYGILDARVEFGPRASLTAKTSKYCAALCNVYQNGCSVALFNSSTRQCQLFFWNEVAKINLPINPAGVLESTLFIKSSYKLLHTSLIGKHYPFNFPNAEPACNRFGGRLATKEEFMAAKYDGWELCSCGWVSNGNAYFWVSVISAGCGRTKLHKCARTLPEYNAHCTLQ